MTTAQEQMKRLKRELHLTKERYDDLALELQERENQLLKVEDERNRYRDEIGEVRNKMTQSNNIIDMRVTQMVGEKRIESDRLKAENESLKEELRAKDRQIIALNEEIERKELEIEAFQQKLQEYMSGMEISDALRDIKNYRDDKVQAARTIQALTQENTRLSNQMEDLMTENNYLRELAEVPDNFGIASDLKLASRQKNQDYERLIKALDEEREEREREIAELRQKNLSMTTLINPVGSHERYRGLNLQQLNLVDRYVLNLKSGKDEVPLNDISKQLRKENENLQAKLELLEGRHIGRIEELLDRFSTSPGRGGNMSASRVGTIVPGTVGPGGVQGDPRASAMSLRGQPGTAGVGMVQSQLYAPGGRGSIIQPGTAGVGQMPGHPSARGSIMQPGTAGVGQPGMNQVYLNVPGQNPGLRGSVTGGPGQERLLGNEQLSPGMQGNEHNVYGDMDGYGQEGYPADNYGGTSYNDMLYKRLFDLVEKLEKGGFESRADGGMTGHPVQLAPTPLAGPYGNWNDMKQGYSHRFKTKIPVDVQEFYGEQGFDQQAALYEIASLQLQNIETLELMDRKDKELQAADLEIQEFRNQLKQSLLVQDELFKQYFVEKKKMEDQSKKLNESNKDLKDRNEELEKNFQTFDEIIKNFRKSDESGLRNSLADYAKKLSIQEINLIRLARKYDCLKEDERVLRESYHKIEVTNGERETQLIEKLAELTQWKQKATTQLKILFDMQSGSISREEHRHTSNQFQLYREKYSDLCIKEAQHISRIARLETNEREVHIKGEEIRELRQEIIESELEFEMIKKRLEDVDPLFRKYQSVFNHIVDLIKDKNISPKQVFEQIDRDGNGKMTQAEFDSALIAMHIPCTRDDSDLLFKFLDLDGSGEINYEEFIKKLKRSGIKLRSSAEELIFKIYDAIKKANLDLKRAFDVFDKNGNGFITKQDIKDAFTSMNFGIENKVVDDFYAIADINNDGSINFDEFYRLFEQTMKESFRDERRTKVEELNWRMQIMLKVEAAIKKSGITIYDAFRIIDKDQSGKITFKELQSLFSEMKVELLPSDLRLLFDEMDKDKGGEISYFEFKLYFDEAMRENKRLERQKSLAAKTQEFRSKHSDEKIDITDKNLLGNLDEHKIKTKISLMETREKMANKHIDTLKGRISKYELELEDAEKYGSNLEKEVLSLQENNSKLMEKVTILEYKNSGGITREEADRIKRLNAKMALGWSDLKSSNKTFKNLYDYSANQIKTLKLAIEKKKNEGEVAQNTIKDLQMASDEQALVGKLQHELMISKWNEGLVNKKYDLILDENRQVKMDLASKDSEIQTHDEELVNLHNAYLEKLNILEKSYTEAKSKIVANVSVHRIEEITNKMREIQHQKSELENYNRNLRTELNETGVRLDYLETQKNAIEDIEKRLKQSYPDDMAQQLLEVSAKLSEYRREELKAKRELSMLQQKELYHQNLIRHSNERMKELEEELANWEKKQTEREEFWRKRYNEQQKVIFGKTGQEGQGEGKSSGPNFGSNPAKTSGIKKEQVYLGDAANKNEEIRALKKQIEDYQKVLEDNKQRIVTLENAIKEEQTRTGSILQQKDGNRGDIIREAQSTEEAKKYAHAAQQTIQTLHEIIEDKNAQIQRKEEMLKKLREETLSDKKADVTEIQRLNQLNAELMRERTSDVAHAIPNKSLTESIIMGRVSAPEVEAIMLEKDKLIERIDKELAVQQRMRGEISEKLKEANEKCANLQTSLEIERQRNEAGKLQKEIEALKKTIRQKDQDLSALRKSLEVIKDEYLKINGMKVEQEEEMKNKLKEQSSNQDVQMKLATDRIRQLDKKIKEHEKELKDLQRKDAESREKITLLTEQNTKLQADFNDKDNTLKMEKRKIDQIVVERDKLREEKRERELSKDKQDTQEKQELKQKVHQLQRANTTLRADKSKEFFDEDGNLKEGDYMFFPDTKTLMRKLDDWTKANPKTNLYKELRSLDTRNKGTLKEDQIYTAIQAIGVNLKPKDQATLFKESDRKENNEIEYIDLYNRIKGRQDFGQHYNAGEKTSTIGTASGKPISEPENRFGTISKQKKELLSAGKDVPASKSIEILKNEISSLKRENEKLDKQLKDWKENYSKLDKEHKTLLSKPITKNLEDVEGVRKINTLQKLDTVQELRDRIFELETKVDALEKVLNVEKDPLIQKLKQNKEKLEEEVKTLKADSAKSRAQVEGFYAKKLSPDQIREDMVYEKDMIITNLKDKLDALRTKEDALESKIFEIEQKNLELHLEKESHDLQTQRLNRRIKELDEFKETYQELIKNADKALTATAKRRN